MSNGHGRRETGQLRVESGGRVHLNTTNITNCQGVKEIVAPDDATVSIGYASSVCGKMKPFIPPPGSKDAPASDRRAKPVEYTCEHLPDNIIVRPVAGTRSGIQCQVIHEAGVGQRAVIDKGIIAAVDIWAWVDPGVEVCLRGQGNLIFLDAADAPRSVSLIPAYTESDMTCATFNRPGSLVLVRSDESMQSPSQATGAGELHGADDGLVAFARITSWERDPVDPPDWRVLLRGSADAGLVQDCVFGQLRLGQRRLRRYLRNLQLRRPPPHGFVRQSEASSCCCAGIATQEPPLCRFINHLFGANPPLTSFVPRLDMLGVA